MIGKGFELNPYSPCVANFGGNKMTVYWHVNNLKVSRVDPKEVTKCMECIEGIYEELSITRGEVHKYLGMKLDFWTP